MRDEISISSERDEERCVFLCMYLLNQAMMLFKFRNPLKPEGIIIIL